MSRIEQNNTNQHRTQSDRSSSKIFSTSLDQRVLNHGLFSKIANYFISLNFFATRSSLNDAYALQTQRISTRIFIVIFLIAFFILLIYNAAIITTTTITHTTPTLEKYYELYQQHSSALSCPCSQIKTNYGSFIRISYQLHPVCSTFFITSNWTTYISLLISESSGTWDFRITGPRIFQALRSLCQLAEESIQLSIDQFNSTNYISALTVSDEQLRLQASGYIQQFIQSTTNNFLITLRLIGNTTQANALLSGLFSNFLLYLNSTTNLIYSKSTILPDDCDCAYSSECVAQSYIDHEHNGSSSWIVAGIYSGCLMIAALRASDLRCFFDQTCLDALQVHLRVPIRLDPTPIDSSLLEYFDPMTRMATIIDRLMVDHWSWTISHADYYGRCQPKECTYTMMKRQSILTIVTIMIGILGGLVKAMKLIIPKIVQLIQWMLKYKRNGHSSRSAEKYSRGIPRFVLRYLTNFNVYDSTNPSDDPQQIRIQRISTRIFIVIFLIAFFILLIYNTAIITTTILTYSKPTLEKYYELYQQHSSALSCPCSQITTDYGSFIRINYQLHPVCASFFISLEWIKHIRSQGSSVSDFRAFGPRTFQALRSLCQLAEESIQLSIDQFNSTNYISASTVSDEQLRLQASGYIEQFIQSTTNNFLITLRLIGNTTQANALLSGLFTNYGLRWTTTSTVIFLVANVYASDCSCIDAEVCVAQSVINESKLFSESWDVPGILTGCLLVEALRASDLHCFSDQICLDDLQAHLQGTQTLNLTPIDSFASQYFEPMTRVGAVIDRLMVDRWSWTVSHADYYDRCQPKECTIIMMSPNSILTVVTTMIGLIGGLITVLKLAVYRVVQLVQSLLARRQIKNPVQPINEKLNALKLKIIRLIIDLNLFDSTNPSDDPQQIRIQRISTRIFIVIFLIAFFILLIYNAAIITTKTITHTTPTLEKYYELYQQHSSALSCPCSQITTDYGSFIRISYQLHPVCSSFFISLEWIEHVRSGGPFLLLDFRASGPRLFGALRSLCQLAEESIQLNINQFNSTQYVSAFTVSDELLQSQGAAYVQQFIQSTTNNLLIRLRLIGNTTQANALVSGLLTNLIFWRYLPQNLIVSSWNIFSSECNCEYDGVCTTDSWLYVMNTPSSVRWSVPGIHRGCFIIEALRASDLHCFFDQTCLDDLQAHLQVTQTLDLIPLDSSLLEYFDPMTRITTVIDRLMVDHWSWTISHADYYGRCQPKECTYTMMSRNNIVAVVVIMIGLLGGLITGLKLIVPRFVEYAMKFIRFIRKKRNIHVKPVNSSGEETNRVPMDIQIEELNC